MGDSDRDDDNEREPSQDDSKNYVDVSLPRVRKINKRMRKSDYYDNGCPFCMHEVNFTKNGRPMSYTSIDDEVMSQMDKTARATILDGTFIG